MTETLTTPIDVASVLDAAADLFDVHPWGQGEDVPSNSDAVRPRDPICAALAIGIASRRPSHDGRARAQRAIESFLGTGGFGSLVRWNDTPGRTEAEVVAALRGAAEAARAAS